MNLGASILQKLGESDKAVQDFMKDCHKLYGTTMELYDAADDESKCGFDFS